MIITEPGIYTIPADDYHADPCVVPSLSSSVAKLLCMDSPLHAWTAHPRLNSEAVDEEKTVMDIGTIAHSLLLEGESKAVVLDFDDYRTKASKEYRDAARREGRVPILSKHWGRVQAMIRSASEQLAQHKDARDAFTNGKPEQTLIWEEDGVWLRARLDWLHDSFLAIDDYKSTSATANPEVISRTLFNNGWDIQCALYRRGVKALTGKDAAFRFVVQETAPPYALTVLSLAPDALTIGEKKVMYAIDLWRKCCEEDEWPGYPTRTCYAELPAWEESRWLAKELETV